MSDRLADGSPNITKSIRQPFTTTATHLENTEVLWNHAHPH